MKRISPFLEYTEPQVLTFENAFATPLKILRSNRFPRGTAATGCLYDSSGSLIKISQRFGGCCGDFFPSVDPDRIIEAEHVNTKTISGTGLYLGHFMPHYGHFLLETLSTCWLSDRFSSYDYFLFHPHVFGTNIPAYAIEAFQMLEIPMEKVIFVDSSLKLERIDVAERLFKFNRSANANIRKVFALLKERACTSDGKKVSGDPCAYYISRRYTSWLKGTRVIINEPILERKMTQLGFRVIYPEKMNLRAQIVTMSSADVLVGLSGSALHNCVFMRPGALLIELCDVLSFTNPSPSQTILNVLSSVDSRCIPYRGWIVDRKNRMGFINISETINNIKQELDSDHSLGKSSIADSHQTERSGVLTGDWSSSILSDVALITKSLLRVLLYRTRRLCGKA